MNHIIFDLEATCWDRKEQSTSDDNINEIIEIGAVLIDDEGAILSEFEAFVKPTLNPFLSDFCKQLTTITQEQVDTAETFPVVSQQFQEWISQGEQDYILCSWGFYDRSQLKKDSALHQLDDAWVKPHISVKHQYAKLTGLRKPVGMGRALKLENLTLDGTHHRGIDDARNIAKIFLQYWGKWDYS
ncbi:MAG: exonuclease domain-containing protein [Bacteroidia bacterium]